MNRQKSSPLPQLKLSDTEMKNNKQMYKEYKKETLDTLDMEHNVSLLSCQEFGKEL